ncbi:MAG TPA: hypothetical protein VGM08_04780 [Candidatus Saccharimonadales bacterium]|jgi:hypothetical protein
MTQTIETPENFLASVPNSEPQHQGLSVMPDSSMESPALPPINSADIRAEYAVNAPAPGAMSARDFFRTARTSGDVLAKRDIARRLLEQMAVSEVELPEETRRKIVNAALIPDTTTHVEALRRQRAADSEAHTASLSHQINDPDGGIKFTVYRSQVGAVPLSASITSRYPADIVVARNEADDRTTSML